MRSCVIFYHKNALKIYEQSWIDQCVNSVLGQTYTQFEILELNYGGGTDRFTEGSQFFSLEMENHIEAMNFLINYAFASGFDVVFNTNMDDNFHRDRFALQLHAIKRGAQLVSCNFRYFGARVKDMDMARFNKTIGENLAKGHNVMAHPAVAMHRSFWDADLHYKNILGSEDLDLWRRAFKKGKCFQILPDYLLNYRLHANQVTKIYPK